MKKTSTLVLGLLTASVVFAQKVNGKLKFEQGNTHAIIMDVNTKFSQEVMGQAIDFNVVGSAFHNYKVTNTTADNTTLHHEVTRLKFNFEGMGERNSFDSDKEKDMSSTFGKPAKELLSQSFDMITDPSGKVLMVKPEKFEQSPQEDALKVVAALIQDLLSVAQPPKKDGNSFFKILPDYEVGKSDTWKDSIENETGKFNNTYTLTDITDSTIIVDVASVSVTKTKTEAMGMEFNTTLNSKATGKITIDKATGIVRQKTLNTESTGTTVGAIGEIPVTSKSAYTINVEKPVKK